MVVGRTGRRIKRGNSSNLVKTKKQNIFKKLREKTKIIFTKGDGD